MPERAIFLDRDNTINEDPEGYLGDPAKVRLLAGAATAIASLRRLGYRIIVVSNQSGVARGMFGEAEVEAVNDEISRQLREQAGATIDASYYCPYHPDATVAAFKGDHDWRKPKPGMLMQAAEDFGLDLGQSWMVGDMPRDIAAGAAAGCRTILIQDPDHPAPENESNKLAVSPNFIVKSLADAARIVLREGRNPHPDLVPKLIEAVMPTTVAADDPVIREPAPAQAAQPLPLGEEVANNAGVQNIIVQIDEQALADRLGRVIVQVAQGPKMGKKEDVRQVLDDMLVQLRQMNRQQDTQDFPMGKLLAVVLEAAVAICLIAGVATALGAMMMPDTNSTEHWIPYMAALIKSGTWLLGAAVLQGAVVALLLGGRRR